MNRIYRILDIIINRDIKDILNDKILSVIESQKVNNFKFKKKITIPKTKIFWKIRKIDSSTFYKLNSFSKIDIPTNFIIK